jgi:thioredoxin 1
VITHTAHVTPEQLAARLSAQGMPGSPESSRLLVVYLWGPDCPNCVIFKRSLPKLLERLSDVEAELVEVDVYAHPEVGVRYGVYGIPHFLLFKAGKKLGKMSEFHGESYWLNVVREHAASSAACLRPTLPPH